ncbi:RDD family protein [Psychrobacter sp.]|uniref:RDD family protein n=1 Tax=Psychrobacter sp. TaxID=56811 RepID=UPI0025FB00F6|nr:RDD family protein [Psychrobacter sp.]
MQIYLARNQVQAGPYTLTELNNMLAAGQVDLSDLMWHAGMDQWQKVGDVTHGQYYYNPNATLSSNTTTKRVSVAQLYGKKDTNKLNPIHDDSKPSQLSSLKKNRSPQTVKPAIANQLASISNRVLAVFIDSLLLIACYMPFLSGFNYDLDKITATAGDVEKMTQLAQSVPEHLSTLTSLMFLALFIVQLVLLIKKGQTIGKLVTGIRVVDAKTIRLTSVTNLLLLRGFATSVLYILPVVGPIILLADFIMMVINKEHRSLHDRFAKTLVVKADPKQLEK